MKRNAVRFFLIIMCTIFVFVAAACNREEPSDNITDVTANALYSQDAFDSIIVGESTYKDVYDIAPVDFIQVTSYGGVSDYPLQSGGCIRIQYYGNDLIVGKIELIG